METRDLLIEVGMSALYGLATPSMLGRVLDAVEPLIRADERERIVQIFENLPRSYFEPNDAAEIIRGGNE